MPINGINTGKDTIVQLANTQGQIIINRVKNFTAQQKSKNLETMALDGVNRHINIPNGWSGSFEMERTSNVIDTFFSNLEANYLSGQQVLLTTITETITESDGTITIMQYLGGMLELASTGDWKGDEIVTQKVNFVAQSRQPLVT